MNSSNIWNEPNHPVLFEFDREYLREQGFLSFRVVHPDQVAHHLERLVQAGFEVTLALSTNGEAEAGYVTLAWRPIEAT